MRGIIAAAAYIPHSRLSRRAIAEALGTGQGRGFRTVASYDEDTTSMGVEAARRALAVAPSGVKTRALFFSTTNPAYLDKTNATVIHAALGLPGSVGAFDMVGAVRSGVGALGTAIEGPGATLVVLSDIRTGLPGGTDEREGGDAAAALLVGSAGTDEVIAECIGWASVTAEFLERWRIPGESSSRQWEERFADYAYAPLVDKALRAAFEEAQVSAGDISHLLITGTQPRARARAARVSGVRTSAVADDLTQALGNAGTAHSGLLLTSVLERASPGELIALAVIGDGADVLLFRTTEALATVKWTASVQSQLAPARAEVSYTTFLTWRDQLPRELPRRPNPPRPAAPPSYRSERWKFGFVGSRCTRCRAVHLPPQRVCVSCHAVDQMEEAELANTPGTIATFTVDRLAHSLSPPVVVAVVDFDGGGRYQCELTDVDPDEVTVGGRVEMSFRRLFTADSVHNYFWKARPTRGAL